MDWQSQIVLIYLNICIRWNNGLSEKARRFSNNHILAMTDQEIMTIYIFGILNNQNDDKKIYTFTDQNLREWFPQLKGYDAFVYRLNRLAECFSLLTDLISSDHLKIEECSDLIIDSMPISQAKSKRSSSAKVTPELSSKGFCSSKDLYYYGVKLHVVGISRTKTIPFPCIALMTPASEHDIKILEYIESTLSNVNLYADKAYCDE